jgi:3-deoxy-D-manno-octulosonic-acid transferase
MSKVITSTFGLRHSDFFRNSSFDIRHSSSASVVEEVWEGNPMLAYFLNLLYLLAAVIAFPWLAYQAIAKGKYREGFAEKLLGLVPRRQGDRPCFWLHAVSVGEVNLLEPLLAELDRRLPQWECVISTTTMTGFAQARKKYAGRQVFYAPLDFSWAVRNALERIRPNVLVLAELELWPNLIREAKRQDIDVAVVNGRLSDGSFRGYRRLGPFIRRLMAQIDLIAAQNEEYAERFRLLGAHPESVHTTGSMKFDGAETDRNNPATRRCARLAGILPEHIVFLAGSTQEPEEALALRTFQQLKDRHPHLRLILVPRHPDRFEEVARLLDASGLPWQRRSALVDEAQHDAPARILLVDAVGELRAWWGTAQIAFVGGSLSSRGGQNMIEPAAYGAAVCFGPNTSNFRHTVALLLEAEAAVVVQNGEELTTFVRRTLEEPALADELGRRAQQLVQRHLGATCRTVDLLTTLAEGPKPPLAGPVTLRRESAERSRRWDHTPG